MAPLNLDAARDVLRNSLENSRDIQVALQENCTNVHTTQRRLDLLMESFQDVACKCKVYNIGKSMVDRALGPAASVLRIFLVIQDLQASLLCCPDDGLSEYLATVQKLDDAVRLLKDNSELVLLWLQDALYKFLNGELAPGSEDSWYVIILKNAIKTLKQMERIEESFLGLLENEFRRVIVESKFASSSPSFLSHVDDDQANQGVASTSLIIPSPSFLVYHVNKMQAILERFEGHNDCLHRCASIYIETRSSNVRAALQQVLDVDVHYLQLSLSEFDSVQSIECYIDQWGRDLKFMVKNLLEDEYRLCREVFHDDLGMECFADIVVQSGFYDFIEFGSAITRAKNEAIKLLKLLDIFAVLSNLRLDFNRLFSSKSCQGVQTKTRELIRRVIDGAVAIFQDLPVQVESQSVVIPPLDGRVPRLVRFVSDFCNILLEDEYRTTLLEILQIHCCWSRLKFDEGILSSQIQRVIRGLEFNLKTWSEAYEDDLLSYFFRMNNCWYFCENIRITKLGNLMGDEWLMAYKEDMEHYLSIYLKECWEKLPTYLSEDGLVLFPGGRAFDQHLARKRLEEFNNAFEETYTKQICWVLSDKFLRIRTRHLIMQAIIPYYNNFVQKFMPPCEDDEEEDSPGKKKKNKYVKYSSTSLQDMINFLFQPTRDSRQQHKKHNKRC
ncbi:OLC1v1015291C1 [Oldenlandia corymbosa var. corymbosa]|uniref:Exocyst subunit Exo70 family protein n=1 Tax=Oldenlandia corymbosa var. corymbosa TaxID=529605 RepID=A0AAV1E3M5_OLDCO|nr:OLC1v1015291C1 [Oldenlandia corymbosa var. corymbosa]